MSANILPLPIAAQDTKWLPMLRNPPRCHAYRTTTQTLTTGVAAAIQFDAARYNTGGAAGGGVLWRSTANTRITIPPGAAGLYDIGGGLIIDTAAGGARRLFQIRLTRGGATTDLGEGEVPPVAGGYPQFMAATQHELLAGDYLELLALQDSGGNLNVRVDHPPALWVCWRCARQGFS